MLPTDTANRTAGVSAYMHNHDLLKVQQQQVRSTDCETTWHVDDWQACYYGDNL